MTKRANMIKDGDIRTKLLSTELANYSADPETLVIEELGLCQGSARIDIAVLNGRFIGYEIKSEADTLNRLTLQQKVYNKILDHVILVGYTDHLKDIDSVIPAWWGIIEVYKTATGEMRMKKIRKPKQNREQDASALVQLLWKEEVLDILNSRQIDHSKNDTRHVLWEQLAAAVDISELGTLVRQTLKKRRNWRVDLLPA